MGGIRDEENPNEKLRIRMPTITSIRYSTLSAAQRSGLDARGATDAAIPRRLSWAVTLN